MAALAELDTPQGLAVDREGSLYIADSGNGRIRRVTADGLITSVASGLNTPVGVAVSLTGVVFASEEGAHVVRMIDGDSATVVAGTGRAGYSGDGEPAATAELNSPSGIALDAAGNLFVADGGNRRIRKLTRIAVPPPAALISLGISNGASYLAQAVAPGEIAGLFGIGIGPTPAVYGRIGASGALETSLDGVAVSFDGLPAPLLYASANQINVVAPYGVAGKTRVTIEVFFGATVKAAMTVPVAEAAPGLFTTSNGSGQVIAAHADGSLNGPANAAARGSILTLYATGDGLRHPGNADGQPAAGLSRPILPVLLRIAGYDAEILYAGSAPGFVGLLQINARVPSGFAPTGEQAVVLKIGPAESQPGATMWIR